MQLRRLMAVLGVLALLAAACGGDDDGADNGVVDTEPTVAETAPDDEPDSEPSSDGDPDPAGSDDGGADGGDAPDSEPPVELTASFRGVSAEAITVGFSMLDFDLLQELSLSPFGWGDQQLVYQTFVDDINAKGGINGRMIEPVFRFYSPLGSTEAEAVCLELTQDVETFAVIGGFLGPAEVANTCVVGPQETILIGGRQSPERLAEAVAPWYESGASRTRRLGLFLDVLQSEGLLEGRSIALIGGIQAQDDYERAQALLPDYGIEPVLEVLNEVPDGDVTAQDSLWATLSERVRVSGADVAFIVGSTSGNIRGLRNNGLDLDLWVLDNDGLGSLGESVQPEWADGAITLESLGDIDAWEDETVAECRQVFADANPDVTVLSPSEVDEDDDRWFTPIMSYCRWLRLFTIIATEAGPDLTQDSFREAAAGLGDFELPGQEFNSLGPDKPDASDSFRLGIYDSSIGGRGEIVGLTEIVDVTP